MSVSEQCRPRLIICTTCRAGRPLADDEPTPGARLHAELERLIRPSGDTASVELRQVTCLANCERGCSGAITMPGKWTYLLGFLSSDHAADLLTYSAAYASSANGTVLPSRRPASLRYAVVGRVPPMEFIA
jgi:predicted metal-binding protein